MNAVDIKNLMDKKYSVSGSIQVLMEEIFVLWENKQWNEIAKLFKIICPDKYSPVVSLTMLSITWRIWNASKNLQKYRTKFFLDTYDYYKETLTPERTCTLLKNIAKSMNIEFESLKYKGK